jgi:putative transposase
VICGEGHLRHLLNEYLEHYNSERHHHAKGNVPLPEAVLEEPSVVHFLTGEIRSRERFGGLLKHYYRDAA